MRDFVRIIGLSLLIIGCQDIGGIENRREEDRSKGGVRTINAIDSEKEILEIYGNDSTFFSVYKNNTYTLVTLNKSEIEGNLNYERGFGEDINATVYVLNFDRPGREQYYVRYTKSDSLIPLTQGRDRKNGPYLVKINNE